MVRTGREWLDRLLPIAAREGIRTTYKAFGLLPRKDNKIVFLSRQSDQVPYDYRLVMDRLTAENPGATVAAVTHRFNPDRATALDQTKFGWATLKSLYHLATSKVAVLDSYWPSVSLAGLGDEITVFQMWHSLGKVKQSGMATVDRPHGRSSKSAKEFAMHRGYDYVLAGSSKWNPYYLDSFPIEESQILNIGLPRAAYLVTGREKIAKKIYEAHPELREGKVILYAPTFRRGGGAAQGARRIVNSLCEDGWQVIVKGHANQPLLADRDRCVACPDFSAPQLLTVADYLVTDYSAIALEAALLDVPTYYYLHDLDHYLLNNGLNIDIEEEMPGCTFRTVEDLRSAMREPYPKETLQAYKEKFVLKDPEQATAKFVEALHDLGGLGGPSGSTEPLRPPARQPR